MRDAQNRQLTMWVGGLMLGAAAMYFGDPAYGRRRRAFAQDKLRRYTHHAGNAMEVALRDAGNRWHGLRAEVRRMVGRPDTKPLDDHVLEARVRSRLGRKILHPHSVHVVADKGRITLSGAVAAEAHASLILLVQAIPGVVSVRDRLNVNFDADEEAGHDTASLNRLSLRTGATLGAVALLCYGVVRRSPAALGCALGAAAVAASARVSNTIHIQKTIEIEANPEAVFEVCARHEDFPSFMSNVLEVRELGEGRSHWRVKGPAGIQVEWNAVQTESKPPALLEWRTESGAAVEHVGSIRLDASERGTRLTVRISYRPPAGAIGHAVAALLRRDPRRELEQDLMRLKRLIETGRRLPAESGGKASGQLLH